MQGSGTLDPPEPLLIVMVMYVSGYQNCHFRDVKIKMSPNSAGFCSTFTHGYISRKHYTAMNPVTLKPQKGTTKAAPLVVNDLLFVHAVFHCLCPDMNAVTHVLQPCQGSESKRVLTSVKDSGFKGPTWFKWTSNCTLISGLCCVSCVWHKVDPRTLLSPC